MLNRDGKKNEHGFVSLAPLPGGGVAATWLDGRHTIFGEVVKGQDVVDKISNVARDGSDRPRTPVVMNAVKIVELK